MSIPTIEIDPFFSGSASDRKSVAAAVDAAGGNLGFLRVVDPTLTSELVAESVRQAQRFFSLPREAKLACRPANPDDFNGYWGPESELSGALFGSKTHFDLKEKFKASRPEDIGAYDPATPKIGWAYQPNPWPADLPEFETSFVAYYRALERVGNRVMTVMAAALDMPSDFFDDKLDRHQSTASWMHYPPQETAPAEGQFRSSAHRDIGSVTLLVEGTGPGLASGGLEIQDDTGAWQPAPYLPGTVMVNVGDLLRRWTNNRWTSSFHRVANPSREAAGLGRISLAFFQKPNFDATLAAIPSCVGEDNILHYAAMPAGEYMRYRMLHSVGVAENVDRIFEPGLMVQPDAAYEIDSMRRLAQTESRH